MPIMTKYIRDNTGKNIGRVETRSNSTEYYTATGRYLGKFTEGKTLDARGRLVGSGDHGVGLIYDSISR